MFRSKARVAMRRRDFITTLCIAAAMSPLAAEAQQVPVVGLLSSSSPDLFGPRLRALRRGFSEAAYVEGRNVTIEYRWAEGKYDRLPAMAADLARQRVSLIFAHGPAAPIAK